MPHLKPLSLWQQDRPDLQQFLPTRDPLRWCILVQHFRRAFQAGLVSYHFLRDWRIGTHGKMTRENRDGNGRVGACGKGDLGPGSVADRRTESVAWIRGRWCRGRMPGSGSERVRPVLSELSAMDSRPVRIEADNGAGWPLQTGSSKRLRQTLPSGVKGSSVSPKKNATLRSKAGPQVRAPGAGLSAFSDVSLGRVATAKGFASRQRPRAQVAVERTGLDEGRAGYF